MSSIPLPALDIKPPQTPDVMGQFGNLLRLKALQQQMGQQAALAPLQRQAAEQQVQSGQLQLQQQQQALKDQQAFRAAMSDPSMQGKTIGQVADVLARKGAISQTAWVGAKKADVDHRTALAGLDEKQLANQKAAHDATQQLYNNVMNMPDDQLAANWASIAQQYDAIPGNQKVPLNPNQPMTKQQLAQFGPMLSMGNAYFDQELARRKAVADEQVAENNASFGPTGPAAEAKYRFILQKKAAGGKLTPGEVSFAKGYEASQAKSTSTSDTLGITSHNFSRPAGLATVGVRTSGGGPSPSSAGGNSPAVQSTGAGALSPAHIKGDLVDLIGQYREDPRTLSRLQYKHPEIMGMVRAKYPDWDETNYGAKNSIVQKYTSGPESRSINAIGTALGHANELRDAIDAMGNGNFDLNHLRSIGKSIGVEVGNDPTTAFNLIVHRLAPEITAAYVQGGGGEGERAANAEDFSPSMSRRQLLKNWGETVKLLQSKLAQDKQQWDTTYRPSSPQDQFYARFLSAPAKAAIQRWAVETGNPAPGGGGGGDFFSKFGGKGH